jgi:hypothetical protein
MVDLEGEGEVATAIESLRSGTRTKSKKTRHVTVAISEWVDLEQIDE